MSEPIQMDVKCNRCEGRIFTLTSTYLDFQKKYYEYVLRCAQCETLTGLNFVGNRREKKALEIYSRSELNGIITFQPK